MSDPDFPPAARMGATVRDDRTGLRCTVAGYQPSTGLVFVTWPDGSGTGSSAWKPIEHLTPDNACGIANTAGRPLVGPAEFQQRGYLQELNRRFLHPLGLALAVDVDQVNDDGSFPVQIWDYRDDPEGFLFADLTDDDAQAKWAQVTDELLAKQAHRKEVLLGPGCSIQGDAIVQAIGTKLPATNEEHTDA